ncbi:phosphoenolpyruvate--protein phosphotransferase [Actinotalea sp. M2MS4P-6]|uniref:phosphoenolpyruvate--protein phosphotransferase n=1 Tax=Actinotalea sp. M2MS4P-6 TaxID=2983762 RepID=UPI0021E48F81|nr:phosphoenolpyruvate--protein phosphotransferase [Actinotalea sp. M2MS4P-6]MCV2395493.1 phosphoenolpyruvate--protein phosphotransferase [Actinotalea sp. M2MS4P-6]
MSQARVISGVGVGRGAVVGPVARAHPVPVVSAAAPAPSDPEEAATRLTEVFSQVAASLQARADAASGTLKDVLSATALMASDPALGSQAVERVRGGTDPALAVWQVAGEFIEMFTAVGGYMAERATDLASVRDRVVAALMGLPEPGVPALERPSVVVAEDLSPADTAVLDLDNVLGIVIEKGGPTSHTAIIAGQLGLPCVVRAGEASALVDGDVVAVDAAHGTVTVDPDDAVVAAVVARREALAALGEDTGDGATADGHGVQLLANIGTAADAERLTDAAVQGVGLFRTEVLFLDAQTAPAQDEQAANYGRALAALGGRKVVIRTLDAGADKPLAFVTQPGEENPALGVRGYRLVRTAPELLTTQLAAIAQAQASTGGRPWVMAPMIATVGEAADFAAAAREAGLDTVGVMIEVPAIALRARDVLAVVDFVSIGTNDLAQYTMATDRLRGELVDLLDMWQPAILDLVAGTAEVGAEVGKPVGVCGESAADPIMALVLTGMGVTSLSMSPASIPAVRFALRQHTMETCQAMAQAARSAPSAAEARAAALAHVEPHVRDVLALD